MIEFYICPSELICDFPFHPRRCVVIRRLATGLFDKSIAVVRLDVPLPPGTYKIKEPIEYLALTGRIINLLPAIKKNNWPIHVNVGYYPQHDLLAKRKLKAESFIFQDICFIYHKENEAIRNFWPLIDEKGCSIISLMDNTDLKKLNYNNPIIEIREECKLSLIPFENRMKNLLTKIIAEFPNSIMMSKIMPFYVDNIELYRVGTNIWKLPCNIDIGELYYWLLTNDCVIYYGHSLVILPDYARSNDYTPDLIDNIISHYALSYMLISYGNGLWRISTNGWFLRNKQIGIIKR
jgi:hypothetical protein